MGSAVEVVNGRRNQYGPRQTDEFVGAEISNGAYEREASVRVRGYAIDQAANPGVAANMLGNITIPKGASVVSVTYRSGGGMTTGGTTPTLALQDTDGNALGSAASNANITAAKGTVTDLTGTLANGWEAPLTANRILQVVKGNVNNTFSAEGQGTFIVHYRGGIHSSSE